MTIEEHKEIAELWRKLHITFSPNNHIYYADLVNHLIAIHRNDAYLQGYNKCATEYNQRMLDAKDHGCEF